MNAPETNLSVPQFILDTFATRYTCKRYEPGTTIPDEQFNVLLEVARRSPSSFGLEPWKLLVIEDAELLEAIRDVSWGAKRNAARTVVILARKGVTAHSDYVEHIMRDVQGATSEDIEQRRAMFGTFQERDLGVIGNERALFDWASKQTYIVLGNMLTAAAMMGIDSTPVEGFNPPALNALLAERGLMNPEEFGVSVMVQFGRAAADHFEPRQTRRALEDVVEVVR